jgi:hypothetical protein
MDVAVVYELSNHTGNNDLSNVGDAMRFETDLYLYSHLENIAIPSK